MLTELSRQGLVRRSGEDRVDWSHALPLQDFFEHDAELSAGDLVDLRKVALRVHAAAQRYGEHRAWCSVQHVLTLAELPVSLS
jgi:hypothetical protein